MGFSKNIVNGDCSYEIKRCLLLGIKAVTNLDNLLKSRHYFADKGPSSQSYVFFPVVMYKCEFSLWSNPHVCMFCCYVILDCLTLEKISCLDQVNLFVREGMRLQHIFISASEVPKQQKDSITVFISTPRPSFTNCLQVLMLETSHQTTSKAGTQSYSSANWLPKVILSSQTPQNTPLMQPFPSDGRDSAPPTRA